MANALGSTPMDNEITVGIDEAGRGPVLGPLVLCGVAANPEQLAQLGTLGLADSKTYGSSAAAKAIRHRLARCICETAAVQIVLAESDEIDAYTCLGGLNRLEHALAVRAIEALPRAARIIADGARLFAPLGRRYPQLVALDRADASELIVAAASIVAKAERDERLAALLAPHEAEFGPIRGGGYPNAATAAFLERYVAHHRSLPPGTRLSWGWPVLEKLQASLRQQVVHA